MDTQQLVVVPPAYQRKGVGDVPAHLFFVRQRVSDLHLCPQLRLYAEKLQSFGVHGNFVPAFRGASHRGLGKAPLGVVVVHVADFGVVLFKSALRGKTQHRPHAHGFDVGMCRKHRDLVFVHVLERTVGIPADRAKLVVLVRLVDGHYDGKEGREQQGGQGDRQHRDDVPLFRGHQGLEA